nr:hypothetical protein [Tanacetum cinerariifolium]
MYLHSIEKGPYHYKEIIEPANPEAGQLEKKRIQKLVDLNADERKQVECNIRDRVNKLMDGIELTKQERETKLADEFDSGLPNIDNGLVHLGSGLIKLCWQLFAKGSRFATVVLPASDDELTEKGLKQIEADDQAIQTILLSLPEDIYAAVDSRETAQEIWLRVQQMIKGSDIGIQEKKAKGNGRNQFRQYARSNVGNQVVQNVVQNPCVQNVRNQNGVIIVSGIANQNRNGNIVVARAKGNSNGNNGNQIRCYNYRGLGHLARNCTQALTLGTQSNKALIYDLDGSIEVKLHDNCYNDEIFNIFTQEEQYTELLELIPKPHQQMMKGSNIGIQEKNAKLFSEWERFTSNEGESQALTLGTQSNKALIYDLDGSIEVKLHDNCYNDEIFNIFTQEEQYTELLELIPKPHQYSINHQEDLNQQQMNNAIEDKMKESHNELLNMVKLFCEHILRQREQVANLSINITEPSRRLNSFCYYDDDDYDYKESTIPLSDIISQIPPSIVITTSPPVLPIEDPEVSLIMRNEELNTIPEKESNEFIKSSVEDLVPIPRESEDTSGNDSECVLPFCDDFSSINVFEEKAVTFSNPLFNSNDDFTSSDDESLFDEDVPEENVKTYSNPLFEFYDEYISSDVNPLFDEVLEDIECKESYDSNLDESNFLVTPLFDSNEDEYFTLGDDVELLLHRDPSTPIMSVVSILEGFTDEPPLEENDDLFDLESKNDKWKKILYDTPIDDMMTEDKVFDPEIYEKNVSSTYVSLPFEDRHYLFFTYVV